MRKVFFPLTLVILAALVLGACTGTGTTGAQPTSQIPGTGGTAQSTTAPSTGGAAGVGTPSATSATTGASTEAATSAATTGAATSAATEAGTAVATTSAGGLTVGTGTATTGAAGTTTETPSASATTAGGTTSGGTTTGTATVAATAGGVASGTLEAPGSLATGTATTAAGTSGTTTGTATTAAGTSGTTTGTPAATTAANSGGTSGATGVQTQGLYVRLSELLNANVNTQDGQSAGRVTGVVLERPLIAGVDQSTATPNAPTATPFPAMSGQSVFVRFLVLNAASTNGQSSSSNSSQGNQVVLPWAAVASSASGTVTLNVSGTAFSGAPRVKMLDVVSGSMAWLNPTVAYWNGQGLSIPATGANTTSGATSGTNLVFIPRERGSISLTDAQGTEIGAVNDLLINPASGEVIYAVLESSQALGSRVFMIPMRGVAWLAGEAGATIVNRGNFQLNFNSDLLKNAPALPSLDQLQLSPALINQLNAFWNSAIKALPTAPVK